MHPQPALSARPEGCKRAPTLHQAERPLEELCPLLLRLHLYLSTSRHGVSRRMYTCVQVCAEPSACSAAGSASQCHRLLPLPLCRALALVVLRGACRTALSADHALYLLGSTCLEPVPFATSHFQRASHTPPLEILEIRFPTLPL